jgi:hypothetical protein
MMVLEHIQLESLRYDVIQWLCVRNQTYSQLSRALSAIPLDQQKLMDTLDEVAQFHQPKVLHSCIAKIICLFFLELKFMAF